MMMTLAWKLLLGSAFVTLALASGTEELYNEEPTPLRRGTRAEFAKWCVHEDHEEFAMPKRRFFYKGSEQRLNFECRKEEAVWAVVFHVEALGKRLFTKYFPDTNSCAFSVLSGKYHYMCPRGDNKVTAKYIGRDQTLRGKMDWDYQEAFVFFERADAAAKAAWEEQASVRGAKDRLRKNANSSARSPTPPRSGSRGARSRRQSVRQAGAPNSRPSSPAGEAARKLRHQSPPRTASPARSNAHTRINDAAAEMAKNHTHAKAYATNQSGFAHKLTKGKRGRERKPKTRPGFRVQPTKNVADMNFAELKAYGDQIKDFQQETDEGLSVLLFKKRKAEQLRAKLLTYADAVKKYA